MRPPRIAPMLVALSLAACGEIPQPFRHDGAQPGLARPKMERGVTIRPLDGFAAAEPLAAAMVKAMEEREIPAVAGGGPTFGHAVEGRAIDGMVVWTLLGPEGGELISHRQRLPADTDAAQLRRLATEAVATLAMPLALDPDAIPKRDAGFDGQRPVVRIVPLAGLPGDGDKTLTAALRVALDRAGLAVVSEGGDYLVQGSVLLSPRSAIEETAMVNWTVKRAKDGVSLASIDQGGAVPRGRLALPWGALARDIAEGGAAGIAEVVRAAQRRPTTGLVIPVEAAPQALPEAPPTDPTQFTEPRPADIRMPDSRKQSDEARTDRAPAPAVTPPPAKASPAEPAKTVKKASPISATGVKGRANSKAVTVKSSRITPAQR